jgi:hypothetical protein
VRLSLNSQVFGQLFYQLAGTPENNKKRGITLGADS